MSFQIFYLSPPSLSLSLYIYIYIYMCGGCIYPILQVIKMWHKSIFKVNHNRFEFILFFLSDWLPYEKLDLSLPYYLHKAGERMVGYIFFPRVFELCKMQTALCRSWTRFPVSSDNEHDNINISLIYIYIYIYLYILSFTNILFSNIITIQCG